MITFEAPAVVGQANENPMAGEICVSVDAAIRQTHSRTTRGDRTAAFDPAMNMYGTTLRSWDATIQAWRIAWTNPIRSHREEQIGTWQGRDIVQNGTRADGTKTRWTFTEITADSFHWRGEALYPNQGPWIVEGEFLATRRW